MRRVFISAAALLIGLGAQAQQLQLTLDKAVEIALDDNPTIQVADMEIERYDYVLAETKGMYLPTVSFDGSYNYSIIAQQMSKSMQLSADGTSTISAAANLSIPLYAPAIARTLTLNKTQMAAAVESARGSKIALVAEVKKAYYNILLAEQSLVVLEESSAISKKSVDDTQIMYNNGLTAEYDLLTAQVQYSNLQPTIVQTRNSIDVAKLLLKMYLSLPESTEIELEGSLDQMRDIVFNGTDALSTDISQNSDMIALEYQSQLLADQLRLTNSARLPTLAAYGSVTYYGSESAVIDYSTFTPNGTEYYGQVPINVGLSLSIPIFSGLTNINKAKSIKNQMRQLELQKLYAEQGKMVELKSAINNLFTAREKMFSEEATVEQAAKAYAISKTRYDAGVGTMLELNSAQLAQTQSELNYSQAIYDYLSAKCDYDQIIGKEN
ncbi:MAG: TolC family protein [Rikenellaceae bacterium]